MRADAREYLAQILRLDPQEDSLRICELRERFHGADPAGALSPHGAGPPRRVVQRKLDALRRGADELSEDELGRALDELVLDRFPDLQPAARRLTLVAASRDWLDEQAARSDADAEIVDYLRRLWRAPAQQALAMRVAYERRVRGDRLDDDSADDTPTLRQASARQVRRLLHRLRRHQPKLFALEASWFSKILRLREWKWRQRLPPWERVMVLLMLLFFLAMLATATLAVLGKLV